MLHPSVHIVCRSAGNRCTSAWGLCYTHSSEHFTCGCWRSAANAAAALDVVLKPEATRQHHSMWVETAKLRATHLSKAPAVAGKFKGQHRTRPCAGPLLFLSHPYHWWCTRTHAATGKTCSTFSWAALCSLGRDCCVLPCKSHDCPDRPDHYESGRPVVLYYAMRADHLATAAKIDACRVTRSQLRRHCRNSTGCNVLESANAYGYIHKQHGQC